MKSGFSIFGLLCIAFLSKAQDQKTKTYLCANGGINYASLFKSSKFAEGTHGIIGPEFGLSVRTQDPTYWGIEAGMYYSVKGVKFTDSDTKVTLKYAGVFGNILIFFPLINNDDIYLGGGLYATGALNGKAKSDSSAGATINFGDPWKRFDGGIQIRAAYDIKNIVALGLHYDIGVFKTYTSTDLRGDSFNGRNSVFTIFGSLRLIKLFSK